MTRIRQHTVTIGEDGFRATCPVPRADIGWWEGITLKVRGWLDARRNSVVGDGDATHTLLGLEAAYRRGETEAVRHIDRALSSLDRALAPLLENERAPLPVEIVVPTAEELDGVDDSARMLWAQRVREARTANARAGAARERQEQSRGRIADLRSIRESLSVEGDDVRRQWEEAYRVRAAHYTRARFGRRYMQMNATPAVPDYAAAFAPTVVRGIEAVPSSGE